MIRRATDEDLPAILDLYIEAFGSVNKQDVLNMINSTNYMFFVYEDMGIVGYLVLLVCDSNVDIISISVQKKRRRQGIAMALIEYAINEMIKLEKDSIMLEVRESNIKAINLYKKIGFKEISIRKKYYDYTEDALIMKLVLR